ncbi:YjbH domain-containing protein [Octadecabacter sp. G9-8]|uniref:YjbH domain-containing protein n=1 Tax=Octadecabacter dasysiphoniae TaxID=2909341 RepID=A0ABS9CW87_9RHOB|nr:YjbH domain-containing protein [Octadecabacter dasysiphoniae]MCF2871337.1 YjbH domain-containing protein [Octadecabacter dasysiphoniae]
MVSFYSFIGFAGAVAASIAAAPVVAQGTGEDSWRATYTLFGTPGIIDMPSAVALPDGEISANLSAFGDTRRATFSFQVLPRLTANFRYSLIDAYDRSFDAQYLLADEGRIRPAVAIGFRDFLGTGRYSSEYFVATKTVSPNVRVSGGIGWGRLGTVNGFTNPLGIIDQGFETRPTDRPGTGGTVLAKQFFRGDAAFFGGVEWRLNDEWTVLAEYSSDSYQRETDRTDFVRESPLNFGVTWQPNESYQLGAYYLYGSEVGLSATIIVDPTSRPTVSGLDQAPIPVAVRSEMTAAAASWGTPQVQAGAVQALGAIMSAEGFRLIGAEITGSTLRVRYENGRYRAEAQGVGRLSRLLTNAAPLDIDTFVLEPSQNGIALSSVTIRRGDMEQLENAPNATALSYDRVLFDDASGPAPAILYDDPTPAFLWGISPYLEVTLFDGESPARGDVGLEASFQYELRPNLVLAGSYRQRLLGNRDEVGRISESTLPDVRRTGLRYGAESGGGIENLFVSWYARPGRDLYSRVSAGYLERGFAGVSSEVLWKPVDNQLALGAELNYSIMRDFDMGFGFRPACSDINCTDYSGEDYDIVTGHVSAYYDFDNGFVAQVDVGRYLAGDWGATFSLDREFNNGWKVGGYFTLTNVEFEDFGEGSFDKGIRIEVPFDALVGTPTRDTAGTTLSSLERDGGARLRIDGRLYDVVEGGHQGQMQDNWGRFWR